MSSDPCLDVGKQTVVTPAAGGGNGTITRIVIAATFVAEPLEASLAWVLQEAGVECDIVFSPYNQVFQELLTPSSDLSRNAGGISVLLLRLDDFVRDMPDTDDARPTLGRVTSELGDAIEMFARNVTGALIVAVLPPGPHLPLRLASTLIDKGRSLAMRIAAIPGVQLLEEEHINLVAGTDRYDETSDRLAHIPFTNSHFADLALAIARKIHAICKPTAKVLVLDCDNTLWRGVVGEDGIDGIEISAPYAAIQEYAVAQESKGILICLVSKNIEADILEVFSKRTDMRLKPHHVVAHRINWLPKPVNIRSLAEELNLALDSFVFLDDNPIECAQVQAELPHVVTIQVPAGAEIPRLLRHIWNFDKLATTTEDANRTRMYRENSARRAMESSAPSIDQFIAALDIKVDIAEPVDDEWPRVEQLTQRTNQFNFTTRRRTASELKSFVRDGAQVLRVRVSDRFGDYGLVGAMLAQPSGKELVVDTLLLSCRVLGRGVEHAMVRMLGERALKLKLETVLLPFIATSRNVPARAFADSIAAEFATPSAGGAVYQIPAQHASCVVHKPGHDPAEIIEARVANEGKSAGATPGRSEWIARSARYSRLANVLISGHAVLGQMSARGRGERKTLGAPVPPGSPVEAELLEIWEDVLDIDGFGVEDDYFALGGTSLLSVKLVAEIQRRFGAQLRLTAILEAPTVRTLARLIAPSAAQDRDGLVCLRRGGSRNLFLVHDGFGETLLYLNLARRLPPSMSVYGIEPRRLPGIPLAHASIEDMGRFYVERVQQVQPRGPYLLGGMCAGGVIAYEMAACLIGKGELVQMVTILDGATPQAAKRLGRVTRNRLSRLENTLSQGAGGYNSDPRQWLRIGGTLARKVRNVVVYESCSVLQRLSIRLRFALLKKLVRRGAAWPSSVPQLNVMQIYTVLESRYRPPNLADVPVLLVRASSGDGTDTPYRNVYRDEDFGWGHVADKLELVDVVGGHSSMLQERGIESLAAALLARLTPRPSAVSELAR